MPNILAIVSDLMFASRIQAEARAAGAQCTCCMGESAAKDAVAILNQPNDFQTILVDMSLPPDATVEVIKSVADKNPRSRIIAFHSHVRADLHRLAKDAGADEVIPNSQVVIRLNELLTK